MRRTLAIVGAAVLAVTGLAGPASASDNGVTSHQDILLREVAVELDTTMGGGPVNGTYAEIESSETSSHDLNGFQLRGCTASAEFEILSYGPSHEIDPAISLFFLSAEVGYTGPVNADVTVPEKVLNPDDGGVFLLDTSTNQVVNGTYWGMPFGACANLEPAAGPPNLDKSLHFNGTSWVLKGPSPESQIG